MLRACRRLIAMVESTLPRVSRKNFIGLLSHLRVFDLLPRIELSAQRGRYSRDDGFRSLANRLSFSVTPRPLMGAVVDASNTYLPPRLVAGSRRE